MENNSIALEILQDYKKANKRFFIIVIILILCLLTSIGYTFYLLNKYQSVSVDQTVDVNNINTIDNSDIGIK